VAAPVLLARGRFLYLIRPGSEPLLAVPIADDLTVAARRLTDGAPDELPRAITEAIRALGPTPLAADPPRLAAAAIRLGARTVELAPAEARRAREALPALEPREERLLILAVGHAALDEAMRSPEEMLVSLTREEERLERALRREGNAAEQFVTVSDSPLAAYAEEWTRFRKTFERHHAELEGRVRSLARAIAPNLSAVVGGKVAARLIAAAGGLLPLARGDSARLQLLGTRRRPSHDRGPRFGVIRLADRMSDVPDDRRGAYARSLGALAVIAARADAYTHADLSASLLTRRDRRVETLRRRRP
jgi:nucleolar protein 56